MMMRLTALLMGLLLAGCSLHTPAVVELPVEPSPEYLSNQADGQPGLPLDQWWLSFHDERLNLLMAELFAQNLELTQSLARLEQVESLFRITRSAQSPQLSAGASQGRSQQPGLNDNFIGNNQQLSLAAGFEVDLCRRSTSACRHVWQIFTFLLLSSGLSWH